MTLDEKMGMGKKKKKGSKVAPMPAAGAMAML